MTTESAIRTAAPPSGPTPLWGWPHLRTELALRNRRLLVGGIRALGIDLEDSRLLQRAELERKLGLALLDRLAPHLPPADRALLGGTSLFGAYGPRFRQKLPFLLANGYTHHQCLVSLITDPAGDPRGPMTAAIFHLAAGICDTLIDELDLRPDLERQLPPGLLAQILARPEALAAYGQQVMERPPGELRLFLALIAAFTSLTHQLNMTEAARSALQDWAVKGYTVQLESTTRGGARRANACWIRAVAPSAVIGALAARECPDRLVDVAVRFSGWLGEVIGRIDDLIDVADDALRGHTNFLLGDPEPDATTEVVLERLLQSRRPERCAERVLDLLEEIHAAAGQSPSSLQTQQELFQWLFCYVSGELKLDHLRAAAGPDPDAVPPARPGQDGGAKDRAANDGTGGRDHSHAA